MATVLIVEDEDSLRETLSRYLVHEGHEVIATASGYEALEASFDAAPDVLIADWMLKNHIHGLHVADVFRGLHPSLNTILITGFPSRDLLEESDRCGVSRLLEKPFDLSDLQEAVNRALLPPPPGHADSPGGPAIAAIAVGSDGSLEYASPRANDLFSQAHVPLDAVRIEQVIGEEALALLERGEQDWVDISPKGDHARDWAMRTRRRPGRVGWLAVICPRDEEQRRNDPRIRILLDVRSGKGSGTLENHGPILVLERDGVVRRLLVSQIERLGAICYPSDDLPSTLRLLAAEPRALTVMVDFTLAGSAMSDWVSQIRTVRPEAMIVGTGGVGAEADLIAQGAESVLRKPWRINHLLDAIQARSRA